MFLTLEDETGNINVLVWTSVLERYRAELLQGQLLQIKGTVEREGEVIHVIAGHVVDHTESAWKHWETQRKTRDAVCITRFSLTDRLRSRRQETRLRLDEFARPLHAAL